jgi:hypothetical protein
LRIETPGQVTAPSAEPPGAGDGVTTPTAAAAGMKPRPPKMPKRGKVDTGSGYIKTATMAEVEERRMREDERVLLVFFQEFQPSFATPEKVRQVLRFYQVRNGNSSQPPAGLTGVSPPRALR